MQAVDDALCCCQLDALAVTGVVDVVFPLSGIDIAVGVIEGACARPLVALPLSFIALTINGAAAVDRADKVGSLEPGKEADIIFLKFPSIHFMPYHTGINLVETVIKGGKTVYHKEWKETK